MEKLLSNNGDLSEQLDRSEQEIVINTVDLPNKNELTIFNSIEKETAHIHDKISESLDFPPTLSDNQCMNKKEEVIKSRQNLVTNEAPNNVSLLTSPIKIKTQDNINQSIPNKLVNKEPTQNNLQPKVTYNIASNVQNCASTNSPTILEKALIKKIIKTDSIKIKYMRHKLKMERDYHKRKLSLMKELLEVKRRKVKAEEKQATALIRIARSLDRMMQNRHQ